VSIRDYRETDREALRTITEICFVGVSIDKNIEDRFGKIGGKDWAWRKKRHIDADIEACPEGILVAEIDGQVVGYITSRIDQESKIGWIPNLAVLPEHQGRGIGKQLMQAVLDRLRAEGMELAKIETLTQNPVGTTFYPKMGFEEVARQIHYAMRLKDS